MPDSIPLPGYRWLEFLKNVPVRVGIYTGLCLAIVFSAWVIEANHRQALHEWSPVRNDLVIVLLSFFALIPVVRFFRSPYEQMLSGLIGWTFLWLTSRLLGLFFSLLDQDYIPFQIFMLGALSYMISATLSWIGTIVWRARNDFTSHLRQ